MLIWNKIGARLGACLAVGIGLGISATPGCGQPGVPANVAPPTTEDAVRLETPTGVIHGTLLAPVVSSLRPVALIIAGSGPTDRNGNSLGQPGANNSLRLLAEGLVGRGVATLRYDKRGIGESAPAAPSESGLRFETYVDDAVAWIELLKRDPRFSSVTVIGHSEGAQIGALAAQRGVRTLSSP